MADPFIKLVRIENVIGYLYAQDVSTKKAIIYAKGGPSLGDAGVSALWPIAAQHGYMLFVPDYIGSCRSLGEFNFANCVETFYESESFLRGKLTGTICETGESIALFCEGIVLVGSSWGGAMVPFLEKYKHSEINDVVLIKPLTDWVSQGKAGFEEEDVVLTDKYITNGWENIYRGYGKSEWPKIFLGELKEYNPIDNIDLLDGKRVYICHGEQDTTIHWSKSKKYFDRMLAKYPSGQIYFELMNGGHDGEFTAKALDFVLARLSR